MSTGPQINNTLYHHSKLLEIYNDKFLKFYMSNSSYFGLNVSLFYPSFILKLLTIVSVPDSLRRKKSKQDLREENKKKVLVPEDSMNNGMCKKKIVEKFLC